VKRNVGNGHFRYAVDDAGDIAGALDTAIPNRRQIADGDVAKDRGRTGDWLRAVGCGIRWGDGDGFGGGTQRGVVLVKGEREIHIGHRVVEIPEVFDQTTTVPVRLHLYAVLRADPCTVADEKIVHTTSGKTANRYAMPGAERAIGDGDIRRGLTAASDLHIVVSGTDVGVSDQNVGGADVKSVGVV